MSIETLPERFPELLGALINGYVEVGEGWHDIIEEGLRDLAGMPIDVVQIKQKFGGLRFYYDERRGLSDVERRQVDDIVERMDRRCAETCEVCGQPGKVRRGGWVMVLCDEHARESSE